MKTNKLLTFCIALLLIGNAYAQQDVQFTHYMYNTLAVNPAYAGSKGLLNASVLARKQWIGMDGAPFSQTFFVHTPLRQQNTGIGLSVVNDKIGPVRQTGIAGDYSYTLKINERGHQLSMGLKAGLNIINASLGTLKLNDQTDPAFSSVQKVAPNFGAGLYYHTDKWYIGASIPKFLQTKIENANQSTPTQFIRHYYFIGGYVFDVSKDFKLKPAAMVKVTKNAPYSVDISMEAFYMNKVSVGLMYRLKDAVGVLVGYQLNQQFRVGMSYDYTVSKLTNYNSGTVELFLSYDFIYKPEKVLTPRYF